MTKKEKIFHCCHECQDKFEACHDVCVTYLSALAEWKELRDQINAARNERRIYEHYHYDRIVQQHRVNRNKNGR